MEGLVVSRDSGHDEFKLFDTMRVNHQVFLPTVWSLTAFSFLFLPLRYWARWKTFGRFFSDDVFALLAWLCAAAMGAVCVYMSDAMYFTMHLTLQPADVPPTTDPIALLRTIRKYSYGVNISYMLMYTSLWCVKLSFLLFFYRLGPKLISNIKWHWWSVAVFTLLAYGATFATYPYMCTFGSVEQISTPYCTSEQSLSFVNIKVNTALDVATDALIVTIPLNILWRSKIPLRQSLALGGVFSLVIVTITFAILRVALSTVGVTKQMDSPWVLVWSAAEANIAIIVACIGSFRMLFLQNRREEMRQRAVVGVRIRREEKITTLERGASVDEMTSVGFSGVSSEFGTVESTVASGGGMSSSGSGWRSMETSGRSWPP